MHDVAQTCVQLYNQLRRQGRTPDELALIHRTYRFLITIYPSHFQAAGKPFVDHGVGVASILAGLGLPIEIVATGLAHNVYGNGDFGDGLHNALTRKRRALVREALGDTVEELIASFGTMRSEIGLNSGLIANVQGMSETWRHLLLIELADTMEHYVDQGVMYYGDGSWVTDRMRDCGARFVEIAAELGYPKLAREMRECIAAVDAAPEVPAMLRGDPGQRYMRLTVPRSCRIRGRLIWRQRALRLRARVWHAVRATLPRRFGDQLAASIASMRHSG
ncbi:MAG: DUF6817 domain-containing protein [Dongiaceae bacterium]